jgi:hypothetical protein
MRLGPVLLVLLGALLPALAMPADAVPGRVFRISPIVGLADPAYRDNPLSIEDDALAAAFMEVELPPFEVLPNGGTDGVHWGNDRFVIQDAIAAPDGDPPRREDPRFVEQMAYYYLNHAIDRLEALGYVDLIEDPVDVYAHLPPLNTNYEVPEPQMSPDANCCNNGLRFFWRTPALSGQGGFGSSAEDADVITHELGHYLHYRLQPEDLDYRNDTYRAYAEGTADLFSVLLNDDLSRGVGDACQGEWIATYYPAERSPLASPDGFHCIRVLVNDLVWPTDKTDNGHHDGMFWSAPMWTVRDSIGSNATLRLLMEALPLLEGTAFEDLGSAVLLADAGLYAGAHEGLIRSSFASKGIGLPPLDALLGSGPIPQPAVPDPAATSTTETARPSSAKATSGLASPLVVLPMVLVAALAASRRPR